MKQLFRTGQANNSRSALYQKITPFHTPPFVPALVRACVIEPLSFLPRACAFSRLSLSARSPCQTFWQELDRKTQDSRLPV
ncbi:MAG: hypothetical protein ACLQKA_01220 [Bryobacteraceae bacterium]